MSEVLDNIAQGLWKIKRLRKLLEVFGEREVRPGVIVISDERETAKTNRNEFAPSGLIASSALRGIDASAKDGRWCANVDVRGITALERHRQSPRSGAPWV